MPWQYHPLLVLFSVGGLVSVVIVGYCWQYLRTHGWSYLVGSIGLLGLNNAVWVFAATLKTASTDLQTSLLFYKLEFLGLLPNSAVAIVLALAYVGKDHWLTRRTLALLGVVPAAFILLALVNPGDVMIVDPELIPAQGILAFEHEFPPLFAVYLAWLYGAVLAAILVLAWGMATDRVPTAPALVGVVALLFPLVAGVLKSAGVYPPGGTGINIAPAASAIGISVLAVAIIRYRVFELVPVGRDRAIDVMSEGYLLVGPDETVLDANPAAAALLDGSTGAAVQGRPVSEVVPIYDDLLNTNAATLETAGRTLQISRSAVARQAQDAGDVLLVHDVTEQKESEQALKAATEELEALNRLVRHDIRNDTATILGWIDVLEESVEPAGKEHLQRIRTSGEHIAELTEIAGDVVQTLNTDGESEVGPTSLRPILTDELAVAREAYPDAEIETDGEIPAVEVTANELLGSVFRNLLNNAVQHNDTATPVVTVDCAVADDHVEVRVADNGPGIPDAQKESMFGEGEKGLDSPGTGIGLYLVRTLVEQYDGRVWAEDNDPNGVVFVIQLPTAD